VANEVYANDNAIACKAGDGKVIAAMPDVCLSPPSPPAGPVPIPYPDTSFSKDMQEGSKTVQIGGQEVMLKDQSYYKTSPLGDEAATNSFGGSVITHVITGKTYFTAWSMDVQFEGANVDRHMDLTISNCASYPGSTGPMMDAEKLALKRIAQGKCPCCGKALHAATPAVAPVPAVAWQNTDTPMNRDQWYTMNIARKFPNPAQQATKLAQYNQLVADAKARNGCTCKGKTKLLPEPPCDVFFDNTNPAARAARSAHIKDSWNNYRNTSTYQARNGILSIPDTVTKLSAKLHGPPSNEQVKNERQVNHLTPKAAGGCPTGNNNLQPMRKLCNACQQIDARFNQFQ
jgi:hypothetical protein